MLMKSLRQFASAALASLPLLLAAQYHEPLDVTRIMWDTSTRTCVFDNGNYGRIIPLQDGRLLLAAETYVVYNGISIAESADNGKTWTNKRTIVGHGDKLPVAVSDLIQLPDGTIIVGYNPRPSEYKEGNHFGIRCVRSTDAVRDIRADGSCTNEPIPDAQPYASYTWPTFTLNPAEPGSVEHPRADTGSALGSAAPVEWFNMLGQTVASPAYPASGLPS